MRIRGRRELEGLVVVGGTWGVKKAGTTAALAVKVQPYVPFILVANHLFPFFSMVYGSHKSLLGSIASLEIERPPSSVLSLKKTISTVVSSHLNSEFTDVEINPIKFFR